MADARKFVGAVPSAQKPQATKDPHTETSGVEGHEQLKHEYVSSVTDRLPDSTHAHRMNRLREAVTAALKSAFTKPDSLDSSTRFHEQFRKEADEYDRDFHKKYHDDFNTALIFVSLFR